jgi:hypothetical protein
MMSDTTDEHKSHPDIQPQDNREILTNIEQHHFYIDKTYDHRCKESSQKTIPKHIHGLFESI